jgi:tyrosine-protein kinase Etk/Wzc
MKNNNESDPSTNYIKDLLLQVYALRYLYIGCIVAFLLTAVSFNKFSIKVYEINSTIGPVQDNRSSILTSNNLFQGLNSYQPGRPIENDITNLSSFALISTTISKLNLEVGYFMEKFGLFKQPHEIYLESPFLVNIDKSHNQSINAKFYLTLLNDSTFRLTCNADEVFVYNYIDNKIISDKNTLKIDTICNFNKTISNKFYRFVVSHNKDANRELSSLKGSFYFEFYNLDYLAKQYLRTLEIGPISSMSSIINIRFTGENMNKILTFLNNYVDAYFNENLEKKNKIARSTINFIDSQISEISDSLNISESKLKNFRSANQVMDLSSQAQRLYDQLTQNETDLANLKVQERYYKYVIEYYKTNTEMAGVVPPSSMNVADPIMTQLITDLMNYNAQKVSILTNSNEKNLFLAQIENKLNLQRQAIIEHVTNNLNTITLSINEVTYKSEKLSKEISNLPRTEMNMVNMQRKYQLNDVIYTYLLQKRSEAEITLASNFPDYELIEPARQVTSKIKKPREKINYMMALFFAFVLPTLYLIIKSFLNVKITSVREVEQISEGAIIGSIFNNPLKTEMVVPEFPGSSISESFRTLRSNLLLKISKEKSKVIQITSAQPQDGKSFISSNLALSIAAVGFKTIVIDCDLRRPTLHLKFNLENTKGLSNYMVGHASLEEIKIKTKYENLTFIPAGPALPNPSELIEAGILDEMIEILKEQYDYVILDSTPLGIVSEAIILMRYSSQILIVCRNNYTSKEVLASSLDTMRLNNITNYSIVFNDIKLKDSIYRRYNNYYK